MRKILITIALFSAALTPAIQAADGTINFTGSILDTACTVDAGSANQTVPLGNVNKAAFKNAGDTASVQTFKITVSACDPTITRVAARFDGAIAPGNSKLLGLTAGGADGVGVGIFEADGTTQVPLGVSSIGIDAPATGASADLNFVAKYVATAANVDIKSGAANATSTFTMDYN
jgi:major type 1 subunit fimbrin (pilin)